MIVETDWFDIFTLANIRIFSLGQGNMIEAIVEIIKAETETEAEAEAEAKAEAEAETETEAETEAVWNVWLKLKLWKNWSCFKMTEAEAEAEAAW